MNIGGIVCILFTVIFSCMGGFFLLAKEKGARFISGFSSMTKEERVQYDQKQISEDQRNACFLWALLFLLGTIGSYFIHSYLAVVTFLLWLLIFFKDVHVDDESAFGKYRKKNK